MRHGRTPEPRIVDLASHPRAAVSLTVAAAYLGVDTRTVRARVETGELPALVDGKIYRINTEALHTFRGRRMSGAGET